MWSAKYTFCTLLKSVELSGEPNFTKNKKNAAKTPTPRIDIFAALLIEMFCNLVDVVRYSKQLRENHVAKFRN